jgi:hypothetical protein
MRRLLALLLLCAGCTPDDGDLRAQVQLVANEKGEVAQRAMGRIARSPLRAQALLHIEAALHTAPPAGRRNLVTCLRRLPEHGREAAPLLGHLAAFDDDPLVREEARFTLTLWQAQGGPRGRAAAAALVKADEVQGTAE